MKIIFLLAQGTIPYLKVALDTMLKVFNELDVETETIDLCQLPYFNGAKSPEMDYIVEQIHMAKAVVAISQVPMLSMHGAMQTFFDCATMYDSDKFDKPILTVTYSTWLGEVEAAEKILKSWAIIGGDEGFKITLNEQLQLDDCLPRLERVTEDFYRLMKQERYNIGCSERHLYQYFKTGKVFKQDNPSIQKASEKIRDFVEVIKEEKPLQTHIEVSAKEQTIKEITQLLKKQVHDEKSQVDENFTAMGAGIYKKLQQTYLPQTISKKLQQIPHYFIAQHDKSLEIILKYSILDSDEEGFIQIKNGDCIYLDKTPMQAHVEFMLTEHTLAEILSKKMTYQKAFMLGKLKVKGNFALLPKLDQIFVAV